MAKDEAITGDATSRRGFFQTALAGGAALATLGVSGETQRSASDARDELEELLTRHGSELGDIRRVR